MASHSFPEISIPLLLCQFNPVLLPGNPDLVPGLPQNLFRVDFFTGSNGNRHGDVIRQRVRRTCIIDRVIKMQADKLIVRKSNTIKYQIIVIVTRILKIPFLLGRDQSAHIEDCPVQNLIFARIILLCQVIIDIAGNKRSFR